MALSKKYILCLLLFAISNFCLAVKSDEDDDSNSNSSTVPQATLKINSQIVTTVGKSSCNSTAPATIDLPSSVTGLKFRVLRKNLTKANQKADASSCGKISQNHSIAGFTKTNPTIEQKNLLGETACASEGQEGSVVLCIYQGEDEGKELVAFVPYSYNTTKITLDKIYNKAAYNNELRFNIKYTPEKATIAGIQTCYAQRATATSIEGPTCPAGFSVKDTPIEESNKTFEVVIDGLQNRTEYIFKVRLDINGSDYSDWRGPYSATVIPAAFPLDGYDGDGSKLSFNCQQTSADSFLLLLLLAAIVIARKFYKARMLLVLGFIIVNLSYVKNLQAAEVGQMNFGIIGSMYRPDLDNETKSDGSKIFPFYKCFFCNKTGDAQGAINPLIGAEFDWYLLTNGGSLLLGLGTGYTYKSGRAVELDTNDKPDCNKPIKNATVSLHMYQVRPQLTYLADYFVDYFPLFPYAKASLVAHGFNFRTRGEQAKSSGGIKPNGFVFGWQAALGLMLRLDFLEPSAIADARAGGLFDQVYLKAELGYSDIRNFSNKGYNFSAKDIMGSKLPLLWTFGLVFRTL